MKSVRDEAMEIANEYGVTPLYGLVDRIDNEMVELPRGADDKPIHVGNTVYDRHGRKHVVTCIFDDGADSGPAFYADNNDNVAYNPEAFSHERPDSWERIASDIETIVAINDDDEKKIRHELAMRIRNLAKKGGR